MFSLYVYYIVTKENKMICTNCKVDKKEAEFYYNKNKTKRESQCKLCIREKRKARYKKNPKAELSRNKKYVEENKESVNEYKKLWARDNSHRYTEYARNKYRTDPMFRLKNCLRSRLTAAVAGKSASTMELVGCSIDKLKQHLESKFTEGMSWDNYGDWHVDHIKPCASFDLSDPEQQRLCFNYKNLQPLWAADNLSKADSIIQ
jgi:hypothetical protein